MIRPAELLSALPIAALVIGPRTRVIAANAVAESYLGRDLTDRPFVTVLRNPGVNAALEAVLDNGAAPIRMPDGRVAVGVEDGRSLRITLAHRGREIPCEVVVRPLLVSGMQGAMVTILDSSGVEHAERMRRDFVANVSHELRTPLTALLGFIETLRGPARDDPGARARFLEIMEREASRMNRLVSDLLSLSRVESDERRRPMQAVDVAGLVRSVVATVTPQAKRLGIALECSVADTPVELPGDHDQLVQVFHNLIENAMKYGGSGGVIRVGLSRVDHDPQLRGPAWVVEVADDGEGISPEHLPRLTERFYRADDHRSREKGGTGLGLAIVKHIVNRHRGRMRIESEPGHGSRFSIYLPARIEGR